MTDARGTRARDEEGKFKQGYRFGPPVSLRLRIDVDDRLRQHLNIVGDSSKEARARLRQWVRDAVEARLDQEQDQ